MNGFWSAWVMFLVVLNLGITLFLFLWGPRVEIPVQEDGTTGHVWAHGALREGLHKLPLWWIVLSGAMFAIGFAYLVLYPGFGSWKGTLGWSAHGELSSHVESNQERMQGLLGKLQSASIEQLAVDSEASAYGQRLFIDNCAACHGRHGQGGPAVGAPDLVDGDWLYGGTPDDILASIENGRSGTMPPFGGNYDAAGIGNLANYVASLSGAPHSPAKAALGKPMFAVCAACHGADGKGNQALGAPNLSDSVWLYGGDLATIEQTIRGGRSGVMPPWKDRLAAHDLRAIAAWVYGRSHGSDADQR